VPNPHASNAVVADITVRDLTTGGATTMTSALNYAAPQPTLALISAPSGQLFTTTPTSIPFTVKALQQDGTTPIPNTTVTLSVTTGQTRSGPASSAIGSVTASFTAITRIQISTALNPALYLAAGAQLRPLAAGAQATAQACAWPS
jgi:hypothetical protein